MRATIEVSNKFLSELLFGNDEATIVGIESNVIGSTGYITFILNCNPDLVEHKENAKLTVEYKTEVRIINRDVKVKTP